MTPGGVFAALCGCVLLAGCHRPVERTLERTLTDALPRYIGDADKWTARVGGRPDALYRGRLRTVHIEGANVRLLPNLPIHRLVLDVDDVSVNRKTNTLEHIGAARFSARFTEAALQKYIVSRRADLRDFALTLNADGTATVTVRPEVAGFATVPVSLRGAVRLNEAGTQLLFSPSDAAVDVGVGTIGSGLPAFVAAPIAERVNPVADLSAAPVSLVAETVRIERGTATVTGRVSADALRDRFKGR